MRDLPPTHLGTSLNLSAPLEIRIGTRSQCGDLPSPETFSATAPPAKAGQEPGAGGYRVGVGLHSHGEVLLQEAAVAQQARPELHADDAKDEEDKEAEQEDIPQHGQRVQEQVHQDPHT